MAWSGRFSSLPKLFLDCGTDTPPVSIGNITDVNGSFSSLASPENTTPVSKC